MEDKKEYCQNLFQEYKKLRERTKLEAQTLRPGGRIKAKHIEVEDIKNLIKIKEKIKECLELLEDNQLIEMSEDYDFSGEVSKILRNRRLR